MEEINIINDVKWDDILFPLYQINDKCKNAVLYAKNYLADKTDQNIKKRYHLLKNCIAEIENIVKGEIEKGLVLKYSISSDLSSTPTILETDFETEWRLAKKSYSNDGFDYISELYEKFEEAKTDYDIYSQVEGYSSLSVAEVATTEDNARTDLDKLLECCNFKFKNNADNVDRLNELIKNCKNAKDFARVALLLQERKILTSDWNKATFSKWHKHFCNVSKCKYNANYNPEKLKDNIYETLKSGFLCT